jgi:hypothetical protein
VIATLRKVLRLVDQASEPAGPPTLRAQLQAAIGERGLAAQALEAARAHIERVRSVIAAAEPAAKEAALVEKAAEDRAREWALSGALSAPADLAQLNAAADSQRTAYAAQRRAAGAEEALPTLREAEEDARVALENVNDRIRELIAQVMIEELAPEIAEVAALRSRLVEVAENVVSLQTVFRSIWGEAHPYHKLGSRSAFEELHRQLGQLLVEPPNYGDL